MAAPVGSFASGPIMDYFGRRPTLMLSILPLILGWTLLATASSHVYLLIGRMMAGMSVGLMSAPSQVRNTKLRSKFRTVPFDLFVR